MERLNERLRIAARALGSLDELLGGPFEDDVQRDAAIQRFEYSFEAVWKAVQRHLAVVEGLEVGSPKGVVRASFQVGLLTEPEAERALAMVDDRNLTVHTYDEELAGLLGGRLKDHAALLRLWLERTQKSAGGHPAR